MQSTVPGRSPTCARSGSRFSIEATWSSLPTMRTAARIKVAMPQALHNDFGTHAGGVAHGNCNSRSRHYLFQFQCTEHAYAIGESGAVAKRPGFRDHWYLARSGGDG